MKVSAIVVTRGDVDIQDIIDSIPQGWEIVVWDNGARIVTRSDGYAEVATDLSVYGRYAAIEHATGDIIYVQDDDCLVHSPEKIVDELIENYGMLQTAPLQPLEVTHVAYSKDRLVSNMPASRHADFPDSALVGWGAAFHRDLPLRCFEKWDRIFNDTPMELFNRVCDVIFSTLAPRRTVVDYGFSHLPWAEGPGRMFTTNYEEHKRERDAMLKLAREVRDAR